MRYPPIINDHKIFSLLDVVIVKYKGHEKLHILEVVLAYLRYWNKLEIKELGLIP